MTEAERIAKLEREVETHLGIITGLQTVIAVLIQSHHDIEHFRVCSVGPVELTEVGALASVLSEKQRRVAREVAEQMVRLKAVRRPTDPPGTRPE